jgi:phosphatidylserine/phosphatidylglycerophosphate/cardiolipin synthase-like enzyme
MLGSSNLTEGGLYSNREATICLDASEDLIELRALFLELFLCGNGAAFNVELWPLNP